jgi:shikimate 5-dehydrogenase
VVINAIPSACRRPPVDLIEDPAWIIAGDILRLRVSSRTYRLLDIAGRAGASTLGGLALLVSQAAESFRIWTDHAFDIKEMAEAVEEFSQSGSRAGRKVH